MPDILDQLRQNAADRAALLEERDRLILLAKAQRWPVTKIADAVGLARQQVHRIIADAATEE